MEFSKSEAKQWAKQHYKGLDGGNGGMYRQPTGMLFQGQKDAMREDMRAAGIAPREPEEEFYVGRLNYARGARLRY